MPWIPMTDERATIPLISRKHQTSKAVACSFNILSEFPLSEYVKVGNIRDPLFLPRDRSLQSSFVCSHDISRIYGPISSPLSFLSLTFSQGFPQEHCRYILLSIWPYILLGWEAGKGRELRWECIGRLCREKNWGRYANVDVDRADFYLPRLSLWKRTWPPFRDVAAGTFKELLFCDVAVLRGKGVKKEREGS